MKGVLLKKISECIFSIERSNIPEMIPEHWGQVEEEVFSLLIAESNNSLTSEMFSLLKQAQMMSIHSSSLTSVIILKTDLHKYTFLYGEGESDGNAPYFLVIDDNPAKCFEFCDNWIKWNQPEQDPKP
jgi:hypothetical protein